MNGASNVQLDRRDQDMREEVLAGLRRPIKQLPCKYLYDAYGSQLFDRICELDAYYPTRTELAIMQADVYEMTACMGTGCLLIEYGSGNSRKSRVLLDHLSAPAGYVPIDISREHLVRAVAELRTRYPRLRVSPVCADFTETIRLPRVQPVPRRKVVYFPGSTIGNFDPPQARSFLERIATVCGPGGGLLIGVDLDKDPAVLERAYNDEQGVTAAFNRNLLTHINQELEADFVPAWFEHHAFYNRALGRIEMHLVSRHDHVVQVDGEAIAFAKGEPIHTENSYKYTIQDFARLAASSGLGLRRTWTDADMLFSVHYLEAE
jgi:dimethylhistidine N-methyltransferase